MDLAQRQLLRSPPKKRKRKIKRVLLTILIILVSLVLALVVFRLVYRAVLGSSHAIKAPGIDLAEMVEIGGIQQYLYFRGQDVDNPVILFLHGGPGSPTTLLLQNFQYGWENDYTVVQWEQRQSGKTYYANDPEAVAETMSFERLLADAHEVTEYIKNKLGKDKIIVLGHSWGSVLGTELVQKYPEDFLAYIGVGQVVNMMDNERVGFEKALEKAREAGNAEDVAALEALEPYPIGEYNSEFYSTIIKVREYQTKYGLASGMDLNMLTSALLSPYYNFNELGYYFEDIGKLHNELMHYLFSYDAHKSGTAYEIPMFYVIGENDFQTPITLSEAFFAEIDAPVKKFYSVPNAGHATMMENSKEFTRILTEEIAPAIR